MAKEFSYADLNSSINSISENGGLFSESDHATIKDWISTGNYALNACISGDIWKGVPANRFTALPGESGVGKSFLCLNIAREAQKKGYFIIYFDSENAVDPETTERFGIDPAMFRHEPVNTFKEVANLITNICKSLSDKKKEGFEVPKVYMFLDSLSMLSSTKELNDALAGSEKKDMTKGQDIRSLFGNITSTMGKLGIGMTYTTHTYTCVLEGTEIIMWNNLIKKIEDIKVGDNVLTLAGPKEVLETHKWDKAEVIKIELETGKEIICTPQHRFLVYNDYTTDRSWKMAKDLTDGDIILQVEFSYLEIIKNTITGMINIIKAKCSIIKNFLKKIFSS